MIPSTLYDKINKPDLKAPENRKEICTIQSTTTTANCILCSTVCGIKGGIHAIQHPETSTITQQLKGKLDRCLWRSGDVGRVSIKLLTMSFHEAERRPALFQRQSFRQMLRNLFLVQMHWQLLALLFLVCQTLILTLAVRKRSGYEDKNHLAVPSHLPPADPLQWLNVTQHTQTRGFKRLVFGFGIESWRQDCRSCLECSKENGCLRCSERLFLFLNRDGMKCKAPECERCFNKDFCTKCKGGYLLFKGKCFKTCPEGTFPQSTDCVEGCVFSIFGFWGEWSPCQHNGLSCGIRWGHQSRTRELSRNTPEETESLCPPQTESRKCRMKKRCPKDKRKNERREERRNAQKKLKLFGNKTVTEPPWRV
ncbi:R-spondin-2 [Labeo rohita]|uniref:R-spondin-2 n=1 Tax=Labeo rohita TaxID=84645 RepID=A0ABQ8MME2_LABRO|nr:R-spondin-2 [Labeo rohita]